MAASEGQLALEFVRTLSEEAAAHRAYLQLLYAITLGVVGGGLLLIAGAFFWLARRAINDVKKAATDSFDKQVSDLLLQKQNDFDSKIEDLRNKMDSHEAAAKSILDDIVRYSTRISESDGLVEEDRSGDVINFNYIGAMEDKDIKNIAKSMGYKYNKYIVDINPPRRDILLSMTGIILVDLRNVDISIITDYVSSLIDSSKSNFYIISYWDNLNNIKSIFKNYTFPVNGYSSLMSTISKLSIKYKELS